jgi:hypothetical protein
MYSLLFVSVGVVFEQLQFGSSYKSFAHIAGA